jgi:threonine/homoserine/homoserine lactone efflux protein
MMATAVVRGVVVGFCVAAPVGPIGLLCMQKTLSRGRAHGFVAGLGAATADALYGVAAGFGFGVAQRFLTAYALWLRLGGAALMLWLGVQALRAPAPTRAADDSADGGGKLRAWAGTLLLTVSNPMTLMSFAAVIAGNLSPQQQSPGAIAALVLGVFVGSAAWWLTLALLTGLLRGWLLGRLRLVNLAAGTAIIVFALVAAVGALR